MNTKPKCEDIGFEHLWKDNTSSITLAVWPTQGNQPRRRCFNCGREEKLVVKQPLIEEWGEV